MPSLVGLGDGVEHGVGDDAGAIKVECSLMGKRGQKLLKRRRGRPLVVIFMQRFIFSLLNERGLHCLEGVLYSSNTGPSAF